jgi:hypothetical protein
MSTRNNPIQPERKTRPLTRRHIIAIATGRAKAPGEASDFGKWLSRKGVKK